jgi:hypothetical protein
VKQSFGLIVKFDEMEIHLRSVVHYLVGLCADIFKSFYLRFGTKLRVFLR